MAIAGQVLSGRFGKVVVRQKAGHALEIGELLIADAKDTQILMQVYDLTYGSQLSQQNIELISGLKLEQENDLELHEFGLRNYTLASLKSLISIKGRDVGLCKTLPAFFSHVRSIEKQDLSFLTRPANPLFIGKLRSGSKVIDADVFLDGDKVFSHHVLIAAQTGRGKSNLTSCMLWSGIESPYVGFLVLDPHDEYYGRNGFGLKDNDAKRVVYYTPQQVPPGARTLKINLKSIRPQHFEGIVRWSDAQKEALYTFYKEYGEGWIEVIVLEKEAKGYQEATITVVRRRLISILNLKVHGQDVVAKGVFDTQAGSTTVKDIIHELSQAHTVIIDTSNLSGNAELLIGSLVASEALKEYKRYKTEGMLADKPVISIVLEEAPRVLGKDVLEAGPNIFATIAREGRKFRVGLVAITQLPSLIPRQILANIGTKIILGIEMAPERQAIIDSAAQDLSEDDRAIASLDIGEAIVSSTFSRFAVPVKIPLFQEFAKKTEAKKAKIDFSGISGIGK